MHKTSKSAHSTVNLKSGNSMTPPVAGGDVGPSYCNTTDWRKSVLNRPRIVTRSKPRDTKTGRGDLI